MRSLTDLPYRQTWDRHLNAQCPTIRNLIRLHHIIIHCFFTDSILNPEPKAIIFPRARYLRRLPPPDEPGRAPEERHQEAGRLVGDLLVEVLEAEAHVECVLARLVISVAEEGRLAGQQQVGDGAHRPDVRLRERRLVHQQLRR